MKKFTLALLLTPLLIFSNLMIDDFEDGDSHTNTDGWWFYTSDQNDGGGSIIATDEEEGNITPSAKGYDAKKALHFSYILDKKEYPWGPYVEMALDFNGDKSYDASAYQGLSYWYKGSAHTLTVKNSGTPNSTTSAYKREHRSG